MSAPTTLLRAPGAAADLIPLAAAGRGEPLFFFGTLMDDDVLRFVLDRPVAAGALEPASLAGFARVAVLAASYPVLLPAAGGMVAGRLLRGASRRDIARVNHFESGEYRAERRPVRAADGRMLRAWLYRGLPVDRMATTGEPWDFDRWRAADKAAFLLACRGWMAGCPEPGAGR